MAPYSSCVRANDTFVDGDDVVVVWDNSAADGDDIADVDGVTVDFSEFGGAASVAASVLLSGH